jgi:hypothetical protein
MRLSTNSCAEPDFVTGIKKNGGPSNGEIEKLRNIIRTSLSEDAYRLACGDRRRLRGKVALSTHLPA